MISIILYSIGRFFISFLRLDSHTVFLSLNQAQWISLLVVAVAVPLLVVRQVSHRPAGRSLEEP